MLTHEEILTFEKIYTHNIDRVIYWKEQLTKQASHNEWMKVVHKRSLELRRIYIENNEQFTILTNGLQNELSEKNHKDLYDLLMRIFYDGEYEDVMIMTKIIDAIFPYFEKQKSKPHILNLLNMKTFLFTEYYYRQTRHADKYSYQDLHGKIYHYIKQYEQLEDSEKVIIMTNYYNMLCVLPMILTHELNEYLDIYDEFIVHEATYKNIKTESAKQTVTYRIACIHEEIWNMAEVIEHFDQAHLFHFYELVKKAYLDSMHEDQHKTPDNLMAAYYYTSAYIHEKQHINTSIDWYLAYQHLFIKAEELLEKIENIEIVKLDEAFYINYFYPYQEVTNYLFKIFRIIKSNTDATKISTFISRGTKLFNKFPKNAQSWITYAIQSEWCENVLGVLDDFNEQLTIINDIVVKGQVQTYIHSQMVGILATTILQEIIDVKPQLLMTLPFFSSIQSIELHKENLFKYINQAAILHDIGKNKISLVINQQMRKLNNDEFALIKEHPEHPESGILKYTKNFEAFYDIIIGHHKSYDGQSGYPTYFDNVHSPYRILIDLITICDSIDAATDMLGRNYAGTKDFSSVLEELVKYKGTRYNPDLVDIIYTNKTLQNKIDMIVTTGRDEVYFQTYKDYFR